MNTSADYFDELYSNSNDPWQYRKRWYEQRKRALTLAVLPQAEYRRVFEPGCSNGELSLGLAMRSRELLCCDLSERAIGLARKRLHGLNHVAVEQLSLPEQWPEGTFDLIVFSEVGYYLDRTSLTTLLDKARRSLSPDGTFLACHWRYPISGCSLNGDEVHAIIGQVLDIPLLIHHQEPDLSIQLWSADPLSVAQKEGLVEAKT